MAAKLKPCAVGSKHSWQHVRNVTITTRTMRQIIVKYRGEYICACGARKDGRSM